MNDEDITTALGEALHGPWPGFDAALTALLPTVRRIAEQRAVELRTALANLTEAVGRGDQYGLPEAYRAARKALGPS